MRSRPLSVYRVQDADGRGPWRPGFSHRWIEEREDHANLLPWTQEFPDALPRITTLTTRHFGCGCRTLGQLERWFTAREYATLLRYGFQAVRLDVDRVLAESAIQCVFERSRPLAVGAEPVSLYGARVDVLGAATLDAGNRHERRAAAAQRRRA